MTIRRSDGTFVKGSIPWNKGLHIDLSHGKGQFKKGNMPPQHREVGSIRHQRDGSTYIKVGEPNKWQIYQRYIWEKSRSEVLGKNKVVIFLDGNKENFSADNLAAVTRKELLTLNQERLLTHDTELSKTGVLIAKLKIKVKEKLEKQS